MTSGTLQCVGSFTSPAASFPSLFAEGPVVTTGMGGPAIVIPVGGIVSSTGLHLSQIQVGPTEFALVFDAPFAQGALQTLSGVVDVLLPTGSVWSDPTEYPLFVGGPAILRQGPTIVGALILSSVLASE